MQFLMSSRAFRAGWYHRIFHTSGVRLPAREADNADLVPTTTQSAAVPKVPNVLGDVGSTLPAVKGHDVVVLHKLKSKDALIKRLQWSSG